MGFWTNKEHRTAFDDAEDLAYPPSGGPVKMWLLGVGLALAPAGYGLSCLLAGHAILPGQYENLDLYGPAAQALAVACIALGLFIHAHWFWGLLPTFETVSQVLKLLAVVVFLGSLGYMMYRIVA
jgi:hypothetical protein